MPRSTPHTEVTKEKISKSLTKHGMKGTRFYKVWENMKRRVKVNHIACEHYYKKNIVVCDGWHEFEKFKDDMYPLYLEHVREYGEKNTTLDRTDNNGNYSPLNCRWATYSTQNSNQQKHPLIVKDCLACGKSFSLSSKRSLKEREAVKHCSRKCFNNKRKPSTLAQDIIRATLSN